MIKSLFGRAPVEASALAHAGALLNAYFEKSFAWRAGQELELFFACTEKPKNKLHATSC